jgi:putative phage-type endonuclease
MSTIEKQIALEVDHHTEIEVQQVFSREQWLRDRKKAIGASDVAAILGVSPYASPWDVWADKTDRVEPWGGNVATRLGQRFEPAVLDFAEETLGTLARNVRVLHPALPVASTLDAQCVGSLRPVEAKTTGLAGPSYGDWGLAGTNEVPENYLVQVHAQLLCTGADLGYLFALLPGRGVVQYEIERSDKLCEQLGSILDDWWQKHVILGLEPSREKASFEIVKRLKRVANKTIELGTAAIQCVDRIEEVKQAIKELEKEKESVETLLLGLLSDAELGVLPDGRQVTYFETKRAGFEVKPTSYRTLRTKKAKS